MNAGELTLWALAIASVMILTCFVIVVIAVTIRTLRGKK